MESVAKSFILFVFALALVWLVFVTLVVIFKNKTGKKIDQIRNFKANQKNIDYAIWKKKQKIKEKKGVKEESEG